MEASWPWGIWNPHVSHPRTALRARQRPRPAAGGLQLAAAVREGAHPVRWAGQQAVVALPEHIDVSNAAQIREDLLAVINRGAAELVADMTATISCDHAGADALARAYQRAVLAGAQLRLVVTASPVQRVLSLSGLDRLVSIYPSLEAAMAAWPQADGHAPPDGPARSRGQNRQAGPADGPGGAITPAVVWELLDALADGVALAGGDGILALASRPLEEMFGYPRGGLAGQPVESLIPAHLQAAHHRHWAGYATAPRVHPKGAGVRMVGLRKDGATFPVEVSFAPLPTAASRYTIAVIRDLTQTSWAAGLDGISRAAAAAEQARHGPELLDRITTRLFRAGLSLQAAASQPGAAASQAIAEALHHIDEVIRDVRDTAFTSHQQSPDAS